MYTGISDARKLHIIEAILKTNDDGMLRRVQDIVDDSKENIIRSKARFSELLGSIAIEDAQAMQKAINDNFEKVNPDDWK